MAKITATPIGPDAIRPEFREQDRRDREKDMIPRALLRGMAALALSALAIATYASLSGAPRAGVPQSGAVLAERAFVLEGLDAQSVIVRDADGTVLMDLPHGGFVTVIQSAMQRARTVARVEGNPPMRVVRYDNGTAGGRLVAEDPATGWSVELYAFGSDNKAAFERLLDQK
jgi:putative photosynthetic complex assembly protein